MRRRFPRVLVPSLIALALAACSSTPRTSLTPTSAPATPPPASGPAGSPAASGGAGGEGLKIAFAYVSPANDGGFYSAFEAARLQLEKDFPGLETVVVESLTESAEAKRTFEQFVADGADMVVAGTEYADFLYEVAAANPDVKFLELHGHKTTDNLVSFYPKAWEVHYLYGMAAGLLTESDKLGFIGSFPIPDVYAGASAFQLGAKSVNPDATTQVVVVNSWFDPPADTQAANALMDGGADFIYGITIPTAYLQVAQERDGHAAGWWSLSQREFGPDAYAGTMVQDWRAFLTSEVTKLRDGTWAGNRHEFIGLGAGMDIDEWGDNIPAEIQTQVDEARAKIMSGELNPFRGPVKSASGEVIIPEGAVPDDYEDLYLWDKGTVEGVTGLQ